MTDSTYLLLRRLGEEIRRIKEYIQHGDGFLDPHLKADMKFAMRELQGDQAIVKEYIRLCRKYRISEFNVDDVETIEDEVSTS